MLNAGSSRNGILTTLRNLWSAMRRDVGSKDYNFLLNNLKHYQALAEDYRKAVFALLDENRDAEASNDRQSSRIEALERRIERATACVTPGANATVRKMAAILRGDA